VLTQPVDIGILHEIVRLVDKRAKVPERVRIRGKEYQLTYLDDHKQRLEEALRRHDVDRKNMLYGQLASKVKYQLLRQVANGRRGEVVKKSATSRGKRQVAARTQAKVTRTTASRKAKSSPQKGKVASSKKPRVAGKKTAVAKKKSSARAARR
jgi:hypothetical protein